MFRFKTNIIGLLLLLFLSAKAQKGIIFPALKGKSLDDKAISIPFSNGKFTVLAIAYSRAAEEDLKKWLNPLFDAFIKSEKESGNSMDLADVYDVNFVFVPVIAGFSKVAEDFKKGTDKQFWGYVMDTEKTDIKAIQKTLGVEDNKIPYFYVLNPEGKVLAFESGKFSSVKLDRLEEVIE